MGYRVLRFLFKGTTLSSSTPSLSFGLYCLLSMDLFRLRLEEEDKDEGEGDPSDISEPSEGDLACSFRKARNSAGAISGCRLAGTQKR